jgi:hypothetical protein
VAEDAVDVEVAPGHRITSAQLAGRPPAPDRWLYSCSCGEITAVDVDTAQDHVEDVTP